MNQSNIPQNLDNNSNIGTIIGGVMAVGAMVLVIFCCCRKPNSDSYDYIPRDTTISTSSTTQDATNSNSTTTLKTEVNNSLSSVKKAVVITENANLRKSGSSTSEVIQTIPEGTNIEVIKQQGAWFFVKNSSQSGWVHGNTIRLIDSTPSYSASKSNNPNVPLTPKNDDIDIAPLYNEVQRRKREQGISDREAVNQILREKGEIP